MSRGKRQSAGKQMKVSERVAKYRTALRASGLRPIQIWVPDVRSRSFRAKAHKQSLAVAKSPHAEVDQAFVDAISEWDSQ